MPAYQCNVCRKSVDLHKNHKGSLVHRTVIGSGKCNGTLQPAATAAASAGAGVAPKVEVKITKPKKHFDPYAPLPMMAVKKVEPITPKKTATPDKSEQRADTYSSVYVFDEKWSAAKCTKQATGEHGATHAERAAFNHVKETYRTEWLGFKQNAPPCRGGYSPTEEKLDTKYCDAFFAHESKARENGGFVFVITADHGDYFSGWRPIYGVEKAGPEYPYTMYCVKGKWTFDKPADAPDSTPG